MSVLQILGKTWPSIRGVPCTIEGKVNECSYTSNKMLLKEAAKHQLLSELSITKETEQLYW